MTFAPDDKTRYGVSKAWNVSEKITTGFFKANIDSQVGSVGMRGNVGIQTIRTDQSSTSNCWDSSAPKGSELKPVSDGKTCTDWLPSLNLAFGLGADQTVRLALAKQVARPRVDRLRSWLEFNIDSATGKPSATGGHPSVAGAPSRLTALACRPAPASQSSPICQLSDGVSPELPSRTGLGPHQRRRLCCADGLGALPRADPMRHPLAGTGRLGRCR